MHNEPLAVVAMCVCNPDRFEQTKRGDPEGEFSNLFSAWVDENLASNLPRPIHARPGLGVSKNEVRNGAT